MTEELKKRRRLRGSWVDWLTGNEKEVPETPETTAMDFIKNKSYSVQYKLQILASCIDVLNEEVNGEEDD